MILNLIFFNRYFDKNRLKALILWSLTQSGEKTTTDLVEKLKNVGFQYATQAGLSLGIDDLKIPPTKPPLILYTDLTVQKSQNYYNFGNLTIVEKFQQLIDVWHRTSEILKQNVIFHFRSTDILNPVYMMAFSGARGNISQVRQLIGMRGLMSDPQGQILDFPIRSNFREGLTLTEYIISCYGARKGLVDTALRTANSGYLTRRLVDVAQHVIVRRFNCKTVNGVVISDMKNGKKVIFSLQKRLIGRVLAAPIKKIAKKNQVISPLLALKISKFRTQIAVRSPLSCEAKNSICQLCYGWSLAHGNLVSLGEAVGVLAAQSIGEPGTQLTMRTFHTGGVFYGDVMQEIRSPFSGITKITNPFQGIIIRTLHGKIAFFTKVEGEIALFNPLNNSTIKYTIPVSTVLFVREFEKVKKKQLLAEYSSVVSTSNKGIQATYNIKSDIEGQVYFEDVDLSIEEEKDNFIEITSKFGSIWILSGKLYESPIHSKLFTKRGDLINEKSILNESIFFTPFSGGLEKKTENKINSVFLKKENKEKIIKKKKEFNLDQKFFEIHYKKIQYKKLGYFISLSNFYNNQFFLINSLYEKNRTINNFSFRCLSKKKIYSKSFVLLQKNFFSEKKGYIFLIPEIYYEISKKNIFNILLLNYPQKIKKNKNIFCVRNKQGNFLTIFSRTNESKLNQQNLENFLFISTHSLNLNSSEVKFLKLNKNFELNPFFFKKNKFKITFDINYHISYFCLQKSLITPYFFLNKKKIRKKNYKYQNFKNLIIFLSNCKEKNFFFDKSFFKIKKKNKKIPLKVDLGWFFIPKNNSQFILSNDMFLPPNFQQKTFHFDQIFIYIKSSSLKFSSFFFFKTKYFKKIRYIYNKIFRYNQNYNFNQIFYQLKKQKQRLKNFSINFLNQRNNSISYYPNLISFIIKNKIFTTNFTKEFFYLLKIQKILETKNITQLEKKKTSQKFTNYNNNKKLPFYDLKIFFFNKQKITKIKKRFPTIDIKIETTNSLFLRKNKKYLYSFVNGCFSFNKNWLLKKCKLNTVFGQKLKYSISQNVEPVPYLFQNKNKQKKTKSKVIFTNKNNVLQENKLFINSFFSFYSGEITTVKSNLIGKEKTLILTNKDQFSFSIKKKNLIVKIGQLIRYGEQIFNDIGVIQSGQIIEIESNKITFRNAQPVLFSSGGIFNVKNYEIVEKNIPLIILFYQKLKTEDIIQGIPKIEELFEARKVKEGANLPENLNIKLKIFFHFYKKKYTSQKAARKSIEKIQQILVNKVQKVYQSQGVNISDKHIEIIVRQMTTKVKILESGRTGFFRGEIIPLDWVEIINLGVETQNKLKNQAKNVQKAKYEPIILGITKAALETESFISAASFQETTRILSDAAIERKTDFLRGLKENVILGNLIPAGTGFIFNMANRKASEDFKKIKKSSYREIATTFYFKNKFR